ncbi:MAG: amidase [Dehalococcoidia bacterium]|nr:amidase [Dehalococcoidia bacterium]
MSEPLMSACEIADGVRAKRFSAREVTDAALRRIEAKNPKLNAFIQVDAEGARRQADAVDAAIARGEDPGKLAGVPMGVKDLEPVKGLLFTEGSRAYEGRIADRDGVSVSRLKAAGAVIVGKTNTPEFGYKGFTVNLLWGASRNPWNPEKTPGGSSGGSASAVAAGMTPICSASDGGGSIRIPASFTGCYGIKPSAHRIPRANEHAPTWGSFSTLGPMARTVRDSARYMDVASGPHPNDLEALDSTGLDFEGAATGPAPRLKRIAYSADLGYAIVDPEVIEMTRNAAAALAEAVGAELVEAGPGFPDPLTHWITIAASGDTRLVDEMTEEQRERLEPGFRQFAEVGRGITAVDVAKALEVRHQANRTMTAFFEQYDLLVTPTTATTPFIAEGPPPTTIAGKPVTAAGFIPFTYPFNFTGHPAASLPAGNAQNGLPVGMQIVGPRYNDRLVLAASAAFEQACPWSYPD